MPRLNPIFSLFLVLTLGTTAYAQTPTDCRLANLVDEDSYYALTIVQWNEAEQDSASYHWADCRAAVLKTSLQKFPQLRDRITSLRKQLQQMRAMEGQLAEQRAGGGTMYSHAVPRTFPGLETRLSSLAALARTAQGGQQSAKYGQAIQQARQDHAEYIKTLRAFKATAASGPDFKRAEYEALISRYEALGQSVMQTLGRRDDAATAVGYSLLNDWTFAATEPFQDS